MPRTAKVEKETIKKEPVKREVKKKVNNKEENKACFILHSISTFLFALSGILTIVTDGFNTTGLTYIFLSIMFFVLAITYYQRYKSEK